MEAVGRKSSHKGGKEGWDAVDPHVVGRPHGGRAPRGPVVVHHHGGGFTLLSAVSALYDGMCCWFCRELGAVVVSINATTASRPSTGSPPPTMTVWTCSGTFGNTGLPDLSRCFLAGDSAGGNLTPIAQRWTATASAAIRIAGIILLQPYFSGNEHTHASRGEAGGRGAGGAHAVLGGCK
ncbi:putative gibberellin receptor GID1L3 [Panicum miliaceum]|uniref:Gibberellin receptor GID1L3 n=1 Tax=Panicum miliaceum TaxID=4540 RepID=A0A3L6T3V8_PANMI|nr:putative gibberellin receptor GID1L3 [Panicum miliaceum]